MALDLSPNRRHPTCGALECRACVRASIITMLLLPDSRRGVHVVPSACASNPAPPSHFLGHFNLAESHGFSPLRRRRGGGRARGWSLQPTPAGETGERRTMRGMCVTGGDAPAPFAHRDPVDGRGRGEHEHHHEPSKAPRRRTKRRAQRWRRFSSDTHGLRWRYALALRLREPSSSLEQSLQHPSWMRRIQRFISYPWA